MHAGDVSAYGLWPAVLLNVLLVLAFAIGFLRPQSRIDWRALGIFTGWLVALFTEMYGVPLTIYGLTALFGRQYPVLDPFTHKNGHLLVVLAAGSQTVYLAVMAVTGIAFWLAVFIMGRAWRQIHQARGSLVTDGLYAHVRHPQYSAMFLLVTALLVQWPTLLTLLMAPWLIGAYVRLARREDAALRDRFGEVYEAYRHAVPAFFPRARSHAAPMLWDGREAGRT